MTGWKERSGHCDRCGIKKKRLVPAFGKYICLSCKDNRPNKGQGNAGVGIRPIIYHLPPSGSGVRLLRVPKSDGLFGKLFFEHYPGSKGIPGRSLCYLAYDNSEIVGIIGVNSPPYNYKCFREYFDVDNDNCFVNNNIFRLISHRRNLGTQVLKALRQEIAVTYQIKYNTPLLGIVTFVEPPRDGAVYKADNWDYLGMTQGKQMKRGLDWEKTFTDGNKKHIFGYKYRL